MNSLLRRIAPLVLLVAVSGCSTVKDATDKVGNWVGLGSSNNTLDSKSFKKSGDAGPAVKYAATLRVLNYADQRNVSSPHYLGKNTAQSASLRGDSLQTDQDVSLIATNAIKRQFDTAGFQVLEGSGANSALFEVSGVIKDLRLDVMNRDTISIAIETTLKEVSTGKVVWSGLVTEKNERYAGVSGDDRKDVMNYLNRELKVVSTKTVEAISESLMAARPELFNLTPGTKPIPGVTVLVAPQVSKTVQPSAPSVPVEAPSAETPASSYHPHASDTAGLLLVNTTPSRARVYLDDVYYGMTPLRVEADPGVHTISVKLAGYKMVTEKVSVRRGDSTELDLNLER